MKPRFTFLLMLVLAVKGLYAQSHHSLQINETIRLPKDSIAGKALTTALQGFLDAAQQDNELNHYVYDKERAETYIQLDEVKEMEKSTSFKDEFFYKPYLTNIVPLNDSDYLVQVAYIGVKEQAALLRASFEFIAHKNDQSFVFSSPLLRNTRHWKTKKEGNNIFHYKNTIDAGKVKEFGKYTALYDKKLNAGNKVLDFYCCENLIELEHLMGISYKADYNGRQESISSVAAGDRKLILLGNNNATFNHFDSHDLFHDRLSLVISRSEVNKPVDEGCAYLYGGSWGLSWKEIFAAFKEQVADKKDIDWREIKEKPLYFKTKGFSNSADYIVNALLVKKIEKEKGFPGVWELLTSGPFEKGNEQYYATLEKLTGISRANYNEKVRELIDME